MVRLPDWDAPDAYVLPSVAPGGRTVRIECAAPMPDAQKPNVTPAAAPYRKACRDRARERDGLYGWKPAPPNRTDDPKSDHDSDSE